MQSTVNESWFIVNFEEAPAPNQVLWGIIESDPSGRWQPGDYVCTSPVLEKLDRGVFVTRNTKYFTVGEGIPVTLPIAALPRLRMGYGPDEYIALKGMEADGYNVEW